MKRLTLIFAVAVAMLALAGCTPNEIAVYLRACGDPCTAYGWHHN